MHQLPSRWWARHALIALGSDHAIKAPSTLITRSPNLLFTMSLGWLTESALLPQKESAIEVDKSSILDLQAIVAAKEHTTLNDIAAAEERGLHKRKAQFQRTAGRDGKIHKRKRKSKRGKKNSEHSAFDGDRNRGVDQRSAQDKRDRKAEKRRGQERLLKKVELYNKLKAAGTNPVAEADETVLTYLKPSLDSGSSSPSSTNSPAPPSKSSNSGGVTQRVGNAGDTIEVTDEFGRVRKMIRGSREHREHVESLRPVPTATTDSSAYQSRLQAEEAERLTRLNDERNHRQGLGFASSRGPATDTVPVANGGIRSQWEVRLSSAARQHTQAIARETAAGQAKAAAARATLAAEKSKLKKTDERAREQAHSNNHSGSNSTQEGKSSYPMRSGTTMKSGGQAQKGFKVAVRFKYCSCPYISCSSDGSSRVGHCSPPMLS